MPLRPHMCPECSAPDWAGNSIYRREFAVDSQYSFAIGDVRKTLDCGLGIERRPLADIDPAASSLYSLANPWMQATRAAPPRSPSLPERWPERLRAGGRAPRRAPYRAGQGG